MPPYPGVAKSLQGKRVLEYPVFVSFGFPVSAGYPPLAFITVPSASPFPKDLNNSLSIFEKILLATTVRW
jgi:hypothetical protein